MWWRGLLQNKRRKTLPINFPIPAHNKLEVIEMSKKKTGGPQKKKSNPDIPPHNKKK